MLYLDVMFCDGQCLAKKVSVSDMMLLHLALVISSAMVLAVITESRYLKKSSLYSLLKINLQVFIGR